MIPYIAKNYSVYISKHFFAMYGIAIAERKRNHDGYYLYRTVWTDP